MRRLLVLPVWLALALTLCAAAPVKIVGPSGPVAPYKLVELQAEGDLTGAAVLWDVTPEDAVDMREQPGGKLTFVAPPGTYKVRCTVVRLKDGQTVADRQRTVVVIGTPTPMPPGPNPPGPSPPPGPAPIDAKGLHVLIVYESADLAKMPPAQQNIIYSQTVRTYLNDKCPAGPDGKTKEWRIYDRDVDVSGESAVWQAAMKRPRTATPWIVISNPDKGGGYEGPLPADVPATMELLKKWGG